MFCSADIVQSHYEESYIILCWFKPSNSHGLFFLSLPNRTLPSAGFLSAPVKIVTLVSGCSFVLLLHLGRRTGVELYPAALRGWAQLCCKANSCTLLCPSRRQEPPQFRIWMMALLPSPPSGGLRSHNTSGPGMSSFQHSWHLGKVCQMGGPAWRGRED